MEATTTKRQRRGPKVRIDRDAVRKILLETGSQAETARRIGCSRQQVISIARELGIRRQNSYVSAAPQSRKK